MDTALVFGLAPVGIALFPGSTCQEDGPESGDGSDEDDGGGDAPSPAWWFCCPEPWGDALSIWQGIHVRVAEKQHVTARLACQLHLQLPEELGRETTVYGEIVFFVGGPESGAGKSVTVQTLHRIQHDTCTNRLVLGGEPTLLRLVACSGTFRVRCWMVPPAGEPIAVLLPDSHLSLWLEKLRGDEP